MSKSTVLCFIVCLDFLSDAGSIGVATTKARKTEKKLVTYVCANRNIQPDFPVSCTQCQYFSQLSWPQPLGIAIIWTNVLIAQHGTMQAIVVDIVAAPTVTLP